MRKEVRIRKHLKNAAIGSTARTPKNADPLGAPKSGMQYAKAAIKPIAAIPNVRLLRIFADARSPITTQRNATVRISSG
jgi:hypothetical protein